MANYTEKQKTYMIETYVNNPCKDTVTFLAVKLRKRKRSIIAKLHAAGVYQKQVYLRKTGEPPRKKATVCTALEELLYMKEGDLTGLILAKRPALVKLEEYVLGHVQELEEEIERLEKKINKFTKIAY